MNISPLRSISVGRDSYDHSLSDVKMLKHVKRHWNETRGDQHVAWGRSWWYFEVANDGRVIRQVEQYESGMLLRYGAEHDEDTYGGLAQEPLDLSEPEYLYIPEREFEKVWKKALGVVR